MTHPFDARMVEPLDHWTLIYDDEQHGSNEQVLTLCLGANFYFVNGHHPEVRAALGRCVNHLQALYGAELKWWIGVNSDQKKYKKFDAETELLGVSERAETGKIIANMNPDAADEYRISYYALASWDPTQGLSELEIRVPAQARYLPLLQAIFNTCCQTLKPVHAFGGIVSAMAWEGDSWQPHEYVLGTSFYGVLVGVNPFIAGRLKYGIFSPTWLLALNPNWYRHIGGDAGLAAQGLPQVHANHYDGGVILQAGEYPEPLPVEAGVPEFWKKYNAWLKPIRNPQTSCFHTRAPDFQQHFDKVTTRMWYQRMDEGAVWPPTNEAYEAINQVIQAERALANDQATDVSPPPIRPKAYPGDRCPQSGIWQAPHLGGQTQWIETGKIMPGEKMSAAGNQVIWYLQAFEASVTDGGIDTPPVPTAPSVYHPNDICPRTGYWRIIYSNPSKGEYLPPVLPSTPMLHQIGEPFQTLGASAEQCAYFTWVWIGEVT